MISSGQKTSLLIPSQLPGFIRDNPEYQNFVLFLQTYYEWMEQNGGVTDGSKNLLTYDDIDSTTEQFINYYINDFLPYFPDDALLSPDKAIKVARQLYQTKGTPASYQFLFRILYNSDFDLFYTKDAVFKASSGTWYVPKSLKIVPDNLQDLSYFQNINGLRVFGETTKSFATIENVVLTSTYAEIFISNIERLFQSGEYIDIIDNKNQSILNNQNNVVRAKVVGQISQISINPNNRGLYYQPGDPVIVYGGLNSPTGIGASAQVGTTTTGTIQRINVINSGYGYRQDPNTVISITNAPGATAIVGTVDPNPQKTANVALIPNDSLWLARNVSIGNTRYSFFANNSLANANTTLANSFTFLSFTTYPISSVYVTNGGGGISVLPQITATSEYVSSNTDIESLASLGILAPIQIVSGGRNYLVNDTIVISGGLGYGAYANVSNVDANGSITSVQYVYKSNESPHHYPLGGMGYTQNYLPTATVNSASMTANGAILSVPGILGTGATFDVVTDRTGSVTSINVTNYGEDYIATPNVSLKIQDIVVSNVSITSVPQSQDVIYQGSTLNTATFLATVDSTSLLQPFSNPESSLFNLRVFNYTTLPNPNLPLKIYGKNINLVMANTAYNSNYNQNGIRLYGDGKAQATASFLNGLVVGQGQYLDTSGQPSGYDVLQSTDYNNYTYQITVRKEIAKYRDILLNLLHPTGMKMLGRYALESQSVYNTRTTEALYTGLALQDYTGYPGSSVTITSDFTNISNNIVQFNNLAGANLATFITVGVPGTANSILEITPTNGPNVRSEIVSLNYTSNTVTLKERTILTYPNVAYIQANSGSNVINIVSLTGSYDIINNGNYSNPDYPLIDIVFVGDTINIANNPIATVASVDAINNRITLTSNLTANTNSLMSVRRTFNNINSVRIFGPLGIQYIPQLITEDGNILITEDGNIILLG